MSEADSMPARLKRLPVRLRIAHLAALLRHERQTIARTLSYPSPPAAGGGGRDRRETAARNEATVDAALCRRLSRRYRSSDYGAAWRVFAADDALLAQGRTAGLRPPVVEDHQ